MVVFHKKESWKTSRKKIQKKMYKDIVDLPKMKRNRDISEIKENNEEHEVNLDAHAIQHIAEHFQNQINNNTS